jgi:cob(I)alamin adenosyltransferase
MRVRNEVENIPEFSLPCSSVCLSHVTTCRTTERIFIKFDIEKFCCGRAV